MRHCFRKFAGIAGAVLFFGLVLAGSARAAELTPDQLQNRGLPAGSALELLPNNAVVHVELHGVANVIDGVEGFLKAAVPIQAVPPDLRELLATEHPLRTLLGLRSIGEPLTDENVARVTGLSARGTITCTLYPGDPRRLFIISLPMVEPAGLAQLLNGVLRPTETEVMELGEATAVRVVSAQPDVPELYLVGGADRLFLCGDRALAMALFQTPAAKRLGSDPFWSRVMPTVAEQHVVVVVDPRLIRPVALQFEQMRPMLLGMLHEKREEILRDLPAGERQAIEQQVRAQLGVESLDQLADYLEAVAAVTSGRILDGVTDQLLAFEGLCLAARLDAKFPELSFYLFSSKFQPGQGTAAIPLDEVRRALAWLGDEADCFSVVGRKPAPTAGGCFADWVQAVRAEFKARGLSSSWFNQLADLVTEEQPAPSLEAEAPWTLTVRAPITQQPSLKDSATLTDYLNRLVLPVERPVTVVPGKSPAFLLNSLRAQAAARTHNQALGETFVRETTHRDPWLTHLWRVREEPLDGGLLRVITESAFRTEGGIFGYDQHELVNRKVYSARRVGDYLVYHQGLAAPNWLRGLDAAGAGALNPATAKLLARVPDGVNRLQIHRVLQKLPTFVDWLGAVEGRIRADLDRYLEQAREVVGQESDPEVVRKAVAKLPMPELLYALCRRDNGEFFALLPGNLVYPRPAVAPVLKTALADYAAESREVGGCLFYTQVQPDTFRATMVQSTEALAALLSRTGNAVMENYLGTPDRREALGRRLWRPGDRDERNLDRMIRVNPRWDFLPRPPSKTDARPRAAIPPRSPEAGAGLIDLSSVYNAALDDSWHQGLMANNTLAGLPRGLRTFNGVPFDVRGIVQLAGRAQMRESRTRFPEQVTGIAVGRQAAKLHFLHGTGWSAPRDTTIGRYVVHYANGQQRDVLIVYGRDVLDWWTPADEPGGEELQVAWRGPNTALPDGPELRLYQTTWENPLPEVEITTVDFVSTLSNSAPFLIALTAD